jgi:hypothetical protein
VYAASLSSLLHILADPRQKALVVVMLGAGLLGLVALFLLDRLPDCSPCRVVTRKPPSVYKAHEVRRRSGVVGSHYRAQYPRIQARRGWGRQPSFVWELGGDRATGHVATAVAYIACWLGGAGGGAGRRTRLLRGTSGSGARDFGAIGFLPDCHRPPRRPNLAR